MIPVLERQIPVFIDAEETQQIQAAVSFAEQEKLRLVIVGGYDCAGLRRLLKKHDVPVIVAGVHRLPRRRGDPYDAPFTVPARLHAAGIQFCIARRDWRFVGLVRRPTFGICRTTPARPRRTGYHRKRR